MRNKKRNAINRHHSSYDKGTEYALRAIIEDCEIKYDGQIYSYDKQHNELSIKDYCTTSIYKPEFSKFMGNEYINPFKELVRVEIQTGGTNEN